MLPLIPPARPFRHRLRLSPPRPACRRRPQFCHRGPSATTSAPRRRDLHATAAPASAAAALTPPPAPLVAAACSPPTPPVSPPRPFHRRLRLSSSRPARHRRPQFRRRGPSAAACALRHRDLRVTAALGSAAAALTPPHAPLVTDDAPSSAAAALPPSPAPFVAATSTPPPPSILPPRPFRRRLRLSSPRPARRRRPQSRRRGPFPTVARASRRRGLLAVAAPDFNAAARYAAACASRRHGLLPADAPNPAAAAPYATACASHRRDLLAAAAPDFATAAPSAVACAFITAACKPQLPPPISPPLLSPPRRLRPHCRGLRTTASPSRRRTFAHPPAPLSLRPLRRHHSAPRRRHLHVAAPCALNAAAFQPPCNSLRTDRPFTGIPLSAAFAASSRTPSFCPTASLTCSFDPNLEIAATNELQAAADATFLHRRREFLIRCAQLRVRVEVADRLAARQAALPKPLQIHRLLFNLTPDYESRLHAFTEANPMAGLNEVVQWITDTEVVATAAEVVATAAEVVLEGAEVVVVVGAVVVVVAMVAVVEVVVVVLVVPLLVLPLVPVVL
ncbi:unnamed protein product [Closterium sp. Naga37s-1]|nr:unnamed protein product [Closterium sp. Naga37s-1]